MGYSFQTFAFEEVATSSKLSQVEVNIRDHVHGTDGVVSIAFNEDYDSGEQVITSGGQLILGHGLSSTPSLYMIFAKCVSAQGNYSVGDEVPLSGEHRSNEGVALIPDGTNITCRIGSDISPISLLDKTTGAGFSATNANWKLIIRAWA